MAAFSDKAFSVNAFSPNAFLFPDQGNNAVGRDDTNERIEREDIEVIELIIAFLNAIR